jgi:O-antigen/teichoic acid export membrane protein
MKTLIVRAGRWTIASYAATQLMRLLTNIVLARLLAPELLGIMVIVNGVRTGVALLTDFGIAQSIVVDRNGDNPDFYNTAWTINLIRSIVLWLVCVAIAAPLARFYQIDSLAAIFPVAGLFFVFGGCTSMAVPLLQKRIQFVRLNVFDIILDLFGFMGQVILALISPTIWALVFGGLLSFAARMVGSYFLIPGLRHRLHLSKRFARQIATFGKWIFIGSIAFVFSTYFDRLYLGKVMPLDLLGVYGVSRALSEPVGLLVGRLNHVIIFPLIASSAGMPRARLRAQLVSVRLIFVLVAAIGVSALAATADFVVGALYDQRYQAAAWMVPMLMRGSWFAIICDLNESTLLGFGRPSYSAIANGFKLGWLLIGLPIGFAAYGAAGAVIVVAASDLFRCVPIFIGQVRAGFSFAAQDSAATLVFFACVGICEWLRWVSGLGTSFANLPFVD